MADVVAQIQAALAQMDIDQARKLVKDALKAPNPDAEIYYLASLVAVNEPQRRDFLQKALADDPFYAQAHADLARLDGAPPAPPVPTPQPAYRPASAPEPAAPPPPHYAAAAPASTTYVIGVPHSPTPLYALPSRHAPPVAQVSATAEVIIAERDETSSWLRCLHINSLGAPVQGWLPAAAIATPTVNGTPVNLIDVPITQYAGHSRSEIERLAELKRKDYRSAMMPFSLAGGAVLAAAILLIFIDIETLLGPAIFLEILGFIIIVVGSVRHGSFLKDGKALKQMVKTDAERFMALQLQHDLLKTAASVGGSMLTRYVPNRQEVTIKRR